MPAVVAAAAGMAAGAAVATGMGFIAGTMAYAITAGVTSMVVSSVVGSALGGNEQQAASPAAQMARGILVNTASTVDPIQVIYGSRRIGGTRCLTEVTGATNEYLNLVIAHCEGPVSAINTIYLDGIAATDDKFAWLIDIEKHLGALDQVASAALIAELPDVWTSAHVGSGVAYTWIRLKYDQNVFHGVPVITADIDGRTLYDPRDLSTAFSANPALCILDYLTNTLYGRGIPLANIDIDSFIAAANTCDITYTDPLGVSRPQHTCNGVVNTDQNSTENIRSLLTSCRGTLLFSARGYGLLIDKAETPTTFEFNEDNIVGSWTIGAGSKRTRFNRVRGNWFNPDREWQPDIWPADSTAFRTTDNGLLLESQLPLPFTSNAYEAQIKTERHMRQSRFGKTLAFRATIAGMDCEVGDVVPVTHTTPGYASKPFRVQKIRLMSSDEVEVEMTEYDDSVYSDTPLTTPRTSPVTNLPDPRTVPAPGIPDVTESKYETTGSAGVKARATMAWIAVPDAFVVDYLPEYRVAAGTWVVRPATSTVTADIDDIAPGSYEFRLRARNAMGVISDYSGTRTKEIIGLTDAPIDVTDFSVVAFAGAATGRWTLTTDLDVKIGGRIFVRWTPLTVAAVWENGVDVGDFNGDATSGPLPMLTGTYFAKFRDSTEHWSAAAASFVLTAGNITALPSSMTVTEHTSYAGAKSGTVAVDGLLKLDGTTLIDSLTGLVDSWGYIDSMGGVATSGTYDFASVMDFGSVVTRRITPTIQALAFDTGDLVDLRGMVDEWDSVDGDVINDATAQLLAAISTDAVSYGAWFPMPSGDVTCRAIKYRLALASGAATHNIQISELSVTANW